MALGLSSLFKDLVKRSLRRVIGTHNVGRYISQKNLALKRRVYTKKFDTKDFIDYIDQLGAGDTIMVQSSWNEFYNYEGKPLELIGSLIEHLGANGNLVMPSNSSLDATGDVFDVRRTPTNAGLLCESFRRMSGVKRSIHLNSSVCAIGKDADYIIAGHQNSYTSWDEHSPYQKLVKLGGKNLTLGLGKFFSYVTAIHCVDSILQSELPYYEKIFTHHVTYRWVDQIGTEGEQEILFRAGGELNLRRYSRYVQGVPHIQEKLSNLVGYSVELAPLVQRGLELARAGVFLWEKPIASQKDLIPYKSC